MGDKPTGTPWRILLEYEDTLVIYGYQERPRVMALQQCAQLFMLSSWQIVQRELNKIAYQSKRGF